MDYQKVDGNLPSAVDVLQLSLPFRDLSKEDLANLAGLANLRRRDAGAILFEEGSAGTEMHIIARGEVSIQKIGPTGSLMIAERGSGDVIGEMSLLDGKPRSATAICKTDCILLTITQDDFVGMVKRRPTVVMGLIASLLERLREADGFSATGIGRSALARICAYLLAEARLAGNEFALCPRPTDSEISAAVSCARETVNRKLAILENKNLIKRMPGKILILDEDGLDMIVGHIH